MEHSCVFFPPESEFYSQQPLFSSQAASYTKIQHTKSPPPSFFLTSMLFFMGAFTDAYMRDREKVQRMEKLFSFFASFHT